jgi:hypothetical protein
MISYQGSEEKIEKMQRKDLKAKNELNKNLLASLGRK